jgi:hypothetical protein
MKAFEDAFKLIGWNPNAAVAHAENYALVVGRFDADCDVHVSDGILDGIVEDVGYGRAKFFRIA